MDTKSLTIKRAGEMLRAGEITSIDLVSACLKMIEEKNKELNIFLEVFNDCLDQARQADEMIKKGEGKPLTGIPIAIKDNILMMGKKMSSGSKMLEDYRASYDSFVVKKLKDAGAVLIGRTNMDEFAMGSSTENSAFGPVRNPYDISRVSGGSSGGSAAAIASGMALGALGSDTGGSIRQPASFCGVVGMKPTYGIVSRSGLTAMSSSLDVIGPLSKTSEDAKMIFECIIGKDDLDGTSIDFFEEKTQIDSLRRIGIPRDFLKEGIDPEVMRNFEESVEKLKESGYEVKDILLPYSKYSLAVYYVIMPAEVSTNLSRFDGIRYGIREEGKNIAETFRMTRSVGFGNETRRRIMLGTYVLSHGYYDAFYNQAWKMRRAIKKEYKNIFNEVDYIMTPTTPTPAFKLGEKNNPIEMYLSDIFTVSANLAGIPSISIPSGFSKNGLPFGLLFTANDLADRSLFVLENKLK